MLIKYRLLIFSLIISFSYIKLSFAGNELENNLSWKMPILPMSDYPKMPLFLKNQDPQLESPFSMLPNVVKALIFYQLDFRSTLNAMYACKMFTNIIGLARKSLPIAWANSKDSNRLRYHGFHPATIISLFDEMAKDSPVRLIKIKWIEKENFQDGEVKTYEYAEDFFNLIKNSPDLKLLLCRYMMGLDPAIHFRQVSFGAFLIERFPELQKQLRLNDINCIKILENTIPIDSADDPLLKSDLMSLKLLSLVGDEDADTDLRNRFTFKDLFYFYVGRFNQWKYKYAPSKSMKLTMPPFWFCYVDDRIFTEFFRLFSRIPLEQVIAMAPYLNEYLKNYIKQNQLGQYELSEFLFLSECFNYQENLELINRQIIHSLEEDKTITIRSFSINFLEKYSFKYYPFYSKIIQTYEEKLNTLRERERNFLLKEIVIFILTWEDATQLDKAKNYIKYLLTKFGPNVKSINFDVIDYRIIHLSEIYDLMAIVAIYEGNFLEAENYLRVGKYSDKNRFDFEAQLRRMDDGLIDKIFIPLYIKNSLEQYNNMCHHTFALLKAMKSQIHNPLLTKELMTRVARILKLTYCKGLYKDIKCVPRVLKWQLSNILDEDFINTLFKNDSVTRSRFLKMLDQISPLTKKR